MSPQLEQEGEDSRAVTSVPLSRNFTSKTSQFRGMRMAGWAGRSPATARGRWARGLLPPVTGNINVINYRIRNKQFLT